MAFRTDEVIFDVCGIAEEPARPSTLQLAAPIEMLFCCRLSESLEQYSHDFA